MSLEFSDLNIELTFGARAAFNYGKWKMYRDYLLHHLDLVIIVLNFGHDGRGEHLLIFLDINKLTISKWLRR